ncbi:MAG: DUF4287 domain-containing protein [Alphaproteobacteria bacterium]|nr:DUF4287 domain-containing protein [Alphaproteobacteria bacterium]
MPAKSKTYGEPASVQKYVAGVADNIEKATGKSLKEWSKIAKTCPHEKMSQRLRWFKDEHGLGAARAGIVLDRVFGKKPFGWDDPDTLVANLFAKSFAEQRPLYEAVIAFARKLDGVVVSPRKGYVALYRLRQLGALRPSKEGLMLGLALQKYPKTPKLQNVEGFGGGERNKKAMVLTSLKDFDAEAKGLLKDAWAEN